MCYQNYIQQHYKDYLQSRKNDEVIKLKSQFTYKLNMYSSIFIILYDVAQAMNSHFELKEEEKNPVREIAVLVLSAAMISRIVVFFLSLLYKPLYQLNLVIDRIILLAYIISGLNTDNTILIIIIIVRPIVLFTTLTFTLVVTITSYMMIFLAFFSL